MLSGKISKKSCTLGIESTAFLVVATRYQFDSNRIAGLYGFAT